MKLSTLIKKLQEFQDQYEDLECIVSNKTNEDFDTINDLKLNFAYANWPHDKLTLENFPNAIVIEY